MECTKFILFLKQRLSPIEIARHPLDNPLLMEHNSLPWHIVRKKRTMIQICVQFARLIEFTLHAVCERQSISSVFVLFVLSNGAGCQSRFIEPLGLIILAAIKCLESLVQERIHRLSRGSSLWYRQHDTFERELGIDIIA